MMLPWARLLISTLANELTNCHRAILDIIAQLDQAISQSEELHGITIDCMTQGVAMAGLLPGNLDGVESWSKSIHAFDALLQDSGTVLCSLHHQCSMAAVKMLHVYPPWPPIPTSSNGDVWNSLASVMRITTITAIGYNVNAWTPMPTTGFWPPHPTFRISRDKVRPIARATGGRTRRPPLNRFTVFLCHT
jgi:hypothetical protein